ncbi:MAG: hypothetical protein M1274_08285 [Actinobacteria bacterium]|nr:hypothetical protein [Actinomycetota bacterium]
MEDFSGMSTAELEELLSALEGDLEDLEQERMYVLGQTGLHVSANQVKTYETEISSLKAKIERVEDSIRAKKSEGAGGASV